MNTLHRFLLTAIVILLAAPNVPGTETENIGITILPAPGKVDVDGQAADWDLSGGIFATGDAENVRETAAVWFHAMYDDKYLYLLARFNDDTPLNNPGETAADYGFRGDCLQVRWIVADESPQERGGHITAWRGRDQRDVVLIQQGKTFKDSEIKDAKAFGVLQAFQVNSDGSGYVQELAVPWGLLTKDGQALHPGDRMQLTIEPNFTLRGSARLTIKDIFKPDMPLNRIFTFTAWRQWGWATLEKQGHISPRPVRLADGREFSVRLEQGLPVIDWTGLIKGRENQGFKNVNVDVPADGIVSLNILNKEGLVVRQLLNGEFLTTGKHQIKWDGLTNESVNRPGEPVPAGEYTTAALYHPQFGLRFRGWACNGGSAPWDGPSGKTNWGGDHGVPVGCAAAGDRVFLVWNGAEGGRMLLATNLLGEVEWGKNFTFTWGLSAVAVDGDAVYVHDGQRLSRVSAASGSYLPWGGQVEIALGTLSPDFGKETKSQGLAAKADRIYLSYAAENTILVLDAKTGKLTKRLQVESPDGLCAVSDNLLYVVSGGKTVLAVNPENGEAKPLISGMANASGIAVDAAGQIYVAVGNPENQVKVFAADGQPIRSLGRAGGRTIVGPWTPDGMAFVKGIAVDSRGQVWAAEADNYPKRVSVWDGTSGQFVRDFFGPPPYAATGGAIMPSDPNVMIGQGCEWRLDPTTGKSRCTAVVSRDGMAVSRFATGDGGRVYLAIASEWAFILGSVKIYERVGEGQYKLRARFDYSAPDATKKQTVYWADENGDGEPQENERTTLEGHLRFSGWWMKMSQDLSICTETALIKVAGFTPCGAPKYDFDHPTTIPRQSTVSADGRLALQPGDEDAEHGVMRCFDLASGRQLWTYPDNYAHVGGSHHACGPAVGMIRGSFGSVGSVKLPEPIGNVWVITTNLGEWHILTERGFYLGKLFEGDPLRVKWPDEALPGAIFDSVPPGNGQEDFGGNIALAADGKFYIQSGSSAFWNVELTGLDRVTTLPGSSLVVSSDEVNQARAIREQRLQTSVGKRELAIKKQTPKFSGNFDDDFRGSEIVNFAKQERQNLRFAAAWDEQNVYLAWQVDELTPWVNSADAPELMYISGDTVDFQLATDSAADAKRSQAALGDLRLSIGNYKGTPTAVVYRIVARDKHPKTFTSGLVRDYSVDSVLVVSDAEIQVRKDEKRYVVEAKVPLASLGIQPVVGTKLRGDFGVTFGDASGQRTRLRTYWSNQHTGIVDDVVYELMLEPQYWGEFLFNP